MAPKVLLNRGMSICNTKVFCISPAKKKEKPKYFNSCS